MKSAPINQKRWLARSSNQVGTSWLADVSKEGKAAEAVVYKEEFVREKRGRNPKSYKTKTMSL